MSDLLEKLRSPSYEDDDCNRCEEDLNPSLDSVDLTDYLDRGFNDLDLRENDFEVFDDKELDFERNKRIDW